MDWRRGGDRMVGCLESAVRPKTEISRCPKNATDAHGGP